MSNRRAERTDGGAGASGRARRDSDEGIEALRDRRVHDTSTEYRTSCFAFSLRSSSPPASLELRTLEASRGNNCEGISNDPSPRGFLWGAEAVGSQIGVERY